MSFGSNVQPKRFGRSDRGREDWVCPCGEAMRAYMVKCHCMQHTRDEGMPVSEGGEEHGEPDTAA